METPEQTNERRAEALCKFVFGGCDCPEGKCEDDGQLEKARAIRASDEAAGMVLVPREPTERVLHVANLDRGHWAAMIAAAEKP